MYHRVGGLPGYLKLQSEYAISLEIKANLRDLISKRYTTWTGAQQCISGGNPL